MDQQAVMEVVATAIGDIAAAPPAADTPQIAVSVGIVVALGASWLSSLGLTIQRKSHLQNERQPVSCRKRDFQRPLWLLGFAIFITSNILGSVFQIGALSITLLAPLGAVSLLWNAFFARILLGDVFSRYLIFGTILIAGGAVLIAIFGVVPEKTHTLEELIQLYNRPSFVIWMVLQFILLVAVLAAAHYFERKLDRSLQDVYIAIPSSADDCDDDGEDNEDEEETDETSEPEDDIETPPQSAIPKKLSKIITSGSKAKKARRWSTPPSYLALSGNDLVNSPSSLNSSTGQPDSPARFPVHVSTVAQASVPGTPNTIASAASQLHKSTTPTSRTSRHVSFGQTKYRTFDTFTASPASSDFTSLQKRGFRKPSNISTNSPTSIQQRFSNDRAEKIRLWLGIAYGSASGTMSGLCLLFAKTGVELLILTVVGQNQFKRWESWMIVLALLVCALLQLFYLNKSLRLVGPTLICPLAFCFYNLSSIFNGLMYYDQWSRLTPLQDGLMSLGIAVLLGGVWIVSIKSPAEEVVEDIDLDECSSDEEAAFLSSSRSSFDIEAGDQRYRDDYEYEDGDEDEDGQGRNGIQQHREETFGDLKHRIAALYQAFLNDQAGPPRGFAIGISAASPGFAIRPQQHHHHHARRNTMANLPHPHQLRSSSNTSSSAVSPAGTPGVRHSHTRSDDFGFPSPRLEASMSAQQIASSGRPTDQLNRSTSEPTTGAEAEAAATSSSTRETNAMLSHRHRRKRSLAGEYYVGTSDPFAEQPVLHSDLYSGVTSPTSPRFGRKRAGSAGSMTRRTGASAPQFGLRRQSSQDSTSSASKPGSSNKASSLSKYLPWHTKDDDSGSTRNA